MSPQTTAASGPAATTSLQRGQPFQLVAVVVGVRLAAVGHVDGVHADAAARRGHSPRLRVRKPRPGREPADDVVEPGLGEDRDTIPGRLPVRRQLVAAVGTSSPSSSASASSVSLVSCRQTTSGRRSSSHGSNRGIRCFSELTFQVAIRTATRYPRCGRRSGGAILRRLDDPVILSPRPPAAVVVGLAQCDHDLTRLLDRGGLLVQPAVGRAVDGEPAARGTPQPPGGSDRQAKGTESEQRAETPSPSSSADQRGASSPRSGADLVGFDGWLYVTAG